jgi:TonB family protein
LRRVQTQQLAELDAAKPVPAEEQPRREVVPPVPRSAAAKRASQSSLHEAASATFSQATVQKTAVIHDESPESTRTLVATEPTQPDPEPVAMSGGTAEVMRPTVEMNEPASTSMQTHAVQAQASEIPAVEQEPRLLHVVQPEYPQEARMRGMEGWVDLTLTVNGKGDVADAHVNASSKRMFERPALMAVRRWQYEPLALPPGDSAHTMRVKVQFRMDGR